MYTSSGDGLINKEEIVEKGIYDLRLHETLHIDEGGGWAILRVAGGWIYSYQDGLRGHKIFIPFDSEFIDEKALQVKGKKLAVVEFPENLNMCAGDVAKLKVKKGVASVYVKRRGKLRFKKFDCILKEVKA